MSTVDELTCFVTILDLGGISAAAERLDVSKSVVSRRLKMLEERLGTQLIVRTTRRQRATNEGQAFYIRARQVLADLAEAEAALVQTTAVLSGQFRRTAAVHFGEVYLTPILTDFLSRHDALVLDLDLADRHVDLVQEGFDLAVRIGRLPDSSLIARKLCEVRMQVCASPDYLVAHGTPDSPDDLPRHFALFHRSGPNITDWYYDMPDASRHRARPQARMISNNDRVLMHAACRGEGLLCVPEFVATDAVKRGDLVEVLKQVNWAGHAAYAVYPPTRHLSNRVRGCVDFLAERIAET